VCVCVFPQLLLINYVVTLSVQGLLFIFVLSASDKYLLSNDKRQLTIVNVTLPDTATYTCNATERYDFDTAHARVIVLGKWLS